MPDSVKTGPRPFSAAALVLAAERAEWEERRRLLAAQGRTLIDPPRLVETLGIPARMIGEAAPMGGAEWVAREYAKRQGHA